jgi:hypothetical protein
VCRARCHFNKKTNKKGPSFSCHEAGTALAVGKWGPIEFDDTDMFQMQPNEAGVLVQVKTATVPTADVEDEDEKKN